MTRVKHALEWCLFAGALALGCNDGGGPATPPDDDAGEVEADRPTATVDRPAPPPPVDAGAVVDPPDVGTPDPIDAGTAAPVDAGCVYEPVVADRNGEPRNAAGHIRWCWPGEPRCTCDRDDDCYRAAGYVPQCRPAGSGPIDAGTVTPRDVPTTPPADLGNTGMNLCSDPVPATTTGPTVNLETIHFNWSMQCYRPEDGSLFVFVEDTETQMVALRFYDFLNDGGPATGDTIDLSRARVSARPFFVSTLSGIVTEPSWSAQRSYLAYEGQVIFHQLQRTSPVGTRMRVEFRNVRAREVRQFTNGRCENVVNGGRMFIRSLLLDLPVNNLHTNEDCIDWAGG